MLVCCLRSTRSNDPVIVTSISVITHPLNSLNSEPPPYVQICFIFINFYWIYFINLLSAHLVIQQTNSALAGVGTVRCSFQ